MSLKDACDLLEYLEKIGIKTVDDHHTRFGHKYPVVATYEVGDGWDALSEYEAFRLLGVSKYALSIIKGAAYRKSVAKRRKKVVVCTATVEELTGKKTAGMDEILAAIIAQGYDLCRPEDGPRLRCLIRSMAPIYLAMRAVRDEIFDKGSFVLEVDDDQHCLRTCYGHPGKVWDGEVLIAFRERTVKKK